MKDRGESEISRRQEDKQDPLDKQIGSADRPWGSISKGDSSFEILQRMVSQPIGGNHWRVH